MSAPLASTAVTLGAVAKQKRKPAPINASSWRNKV
jgi:hypothetical protein